MFVDASALVAVLTREPEAEAILDALDGTDEATTSPLAVYEAVLGVCRKHRQSVAAGERAVFDFLAAARIALVPIAVAETALALDAFARFGKGRGHPAQLNLVDCFAYAAARHAGVPLLFKGGDFSRTDIADAMASADS